MITPKITNLGYSNLWTDMSAILGYASNFQKLITKLFANGEQGFFYDPSDLSTLYQVAAGTVPVTSVGQPVGLVLDKSQGLVLGSELVVNGDFSNGLTGWLNLTGWWQSSNGRAYHPFTNTLCAISSSGFSSNKMLSVTFDIEVVSGTAQMVFLPSDVAVNFTQAASKKVTVYAPSGTNTIQFKRASGFTGAGFYIDNVSVKEIAGNHAYQSVSAMRPLLVAAPQRLDYDAVDDKLITNLPTQLTGCTVIRAVPNAGTQILMNQTIPTTYNDNIDNCGLIVINRALTPSETSAITAEFNKRVGV